MVKAMKRNKNQFLFPIKRLEAKSGNWELQDNTSSNRENTCYNQFATFCSPMKGCHRDAYFCGQFSQNVTSMSKPSAC